MRSFCWLMVALCTITLASWTGSAWAQSKIDPAKLKKGAKLEIENFGKWEPAEFMEPFTGSAIRVRTKDSPRGKVVFLSHVRLARSMSAKGVSATEDPFATEDERAAARKPRKWTAGKFEVEATLVKLADAGTVVLKRKDGKDISVPLEKLSEADQKYVAGVFPDAAPAVTVSDAADLPPEPELPLADVNIAAAEKIEIPSTDKWTYQAEGAPDLPELRKARIPLKPKEFFENYVDLLFLPGEKKAIVVSHETHPGKTARAIVQACDFSSGKVEAHGVFGTDVGPIAVSPDGKLVLARTFGHGFGVAAELRLYERAGAKVTPKTAWLPFGHGATRNDRLGAETDVIWARFLDPDHVLTMSSGEELALWRLPKIEPVYQAKVLRNCRPALSPGGRYLAFLTPHEVALVEAASGKFVGRIADDFQPHFGNELTFSPDGSRLALYDGSQRLRVWDLKSRELVRDFPVSARGGDPRESRLVFLDNNYLLIGGGLVDLNLYQVVQEYKDISWPMKFYDGRLWTIEDARQNPVLASQVVPSEELRAKWAKLPTEDLLVIRPGMEMMVELQTADPNAETAREQIVASLTKRGMKVVPQSNVRLLGTITSGKTHTIKYTPFGALRGQEMNITSTGNILTLSYQIDGQTVWKHEHHTYPPHFLHLKKDQTAEQAVQESMKMDSKAFAHVWLPVHVPRPAETADKPAGAGGG